MRIHELAKELGVSSRGLMERMKQLGMEAGSHMHSLSEEEVRRLREMMADAAGPSGGKDETEPPSPAAPSTAQPSAEEKTAPGTRHVVMHGPIVVRELAERLGLKPNQLIAELMKMNVFAAINQRLDIKVAQQVARRHGVFLEYEKKAPEPRPRPARRVAEEEGEQDRPEDLEPRPPVVTFLGHVDHGKTSLLDRIRNTRVASREAGGITQHIGAYTVEVGDRKITFLDTPGHAAFTAMRARGANVTDIAVLVIAADDGVMPQTEEAIQHARAAGVTMMAAINKIDLKNADADRVKKQLQTLGLTPEDWGGELICCPVSAATGEGIDHLLEMILLQAEIMELKANPRRRAEGYVLEAKLEPGMGPVATLLVKRGTLKVGDALVCGEAWGKVKALTDDRGVKVRRVGPSTPVLCLGLTAVPQAGAFFKVVPDDRIAREIAGERQAEKRQAQLEVRRRVTLDELLRQTAPSQKQRLLLVVKADVRGTLEAVEKVLGDLKSEKVDLEIILSGVGNVTENDVQLAAASRAAVVGFHVGVQGKASKLARQEGVEIRLYDVIYEL
ncbi:MAG TPA: translation initiation factor IF-2, partial [Kiritimatiellae bacterium]|nr:translation initiation factor IF-2 [Kiritimatiellia bacterium]